MTDQSSVLRFIEDNWGLGRLGDQSADALACSLDRLFDFNPDQQRTSRILLNPLSGTP